MINFDTICYSLKDFKEYLNEVINTEKDLNKEVILVELKSKYILYVRAVSLATNRFNESVNVYHLQGNKIQGITELIYPFNNKDIDINKAIDLKLNFKTILNYIDSELYKPKDILKDIALLDYSDTSIKEKVIALKELGILDFLQQEFQICQTSTNKLSEVVSFLIGENSSTIQSYINPMINKGTSQKNNPYSNSKLLEKTQNKLNIIGLNIPKKV